MGFSRTLAVFLCVILASLSFVAQDAIAARALAEASGRSLRSVPTHRGDPGYPGNLRGARPAPAGGGYGGGYPGSP
ncbi:unnamed protein product [Alopecurus aequalis]